MLEVILAMTKTGGIGLNNRMAWRCSEELNHFRKITNDSVLIMGRKTVQNLPKLENRIIICLSKSNINTLTWKNTVKICDGLNSAIEFAVKTYPTKKIFIAGGANIYNQVFNEFINHISNLHVSVMKKDYLCDSFVNLDLLEFLLDTEENREEFIYYSYKKGKTSELTYLNLLKDVMNNGTLRNSRNGETKGVFTRHLSFDLRKGFPLLTTKKMFFRGIVEELLFFLRGDTDTKLLEKKEINIWSGNTNREFLNNNNKSHYPDGEMGPMYGYQWRNFNKPFELNDKTKSDYITIDQIKEIVELIRYDAHSRRILVTDYNPAQSKEGVLYPCHSIILQFYVEKEYLDMFCYNRSSDLFLGLPFNIASSSLLLMIIAKLTDLTPRHFNLSLGDAHIYGDHIPAVQEQLSRVCYEYPTLNINKNIDEVENFNDLKFEDFILENYKSHPSIKAKMIA